MPEPLFAAVEAVEPPRPLLLLSASGHRFDQRAAERLAELPGFSLLCGRYEGVDQRVADHLLRRRAVRRRLRARRRGSGRAGRHRSGDPARARRHGQRRVRGRRVVRRGPARVPAVHPPGRVPGLVGAGGAALGRARAHRALAPGRGAAPHHGAAPRPGREAADDRTPSAPSSTSSAARDRAASMLRRRNAASGTFPRVFLESSSTRRVWSPAS